MGDAKPDFFFTLKTLVFFVDLCYALYGLYAYLVYMIQIFIRDIDIMKEKNKLVLHKPQPVFSIVKGVLKLFVKKPKKVINLAGDLHDKAIIVANHNGKWGPMALEMHFPLYHCVWGAGEMLGTYKERFHYLRDIFYMQKKGWSKKKATSKAWFEAIFNKFVYKGMRVLPTYTNGKLLATIKNSVDALNQNAAVLIFPENSNEGYLDELTEFYPGFVLLAQSYYTKTGEDIPVYPVYYQLKKRILCIGQPLYVNEMVKQKLSRTEIAEIFRLKVNELYHKYCL